MEELNEHQKQLKAFLDNYQKITEVYTLVSQAYDLATFKKEVADTIPPTLDDEYKNKLLNSLTYGIDYFKENLPNINISSTFSAYSGLSMSISGATGSVAILSDIESFCDKIFSGWTDNLIYQYSTIQEKQDRKKYISNIINSIDSKVADEFKLSLVSFEKFMGDVTNQNDCGINCRNVVEHLKGILFQKALIHAKATNSATKKIKDWYEMADYLAIGGIGSDEHRQLQNEVSIDSTVWSDFTHVAKNRNPETKTSLQAKFSMYLDHLFNWLAFADSAGLRANTMPNR